MRTAIEVYEIFARDRPTEWWMTEDEFLELWWNTGIREPVVPARVRRGRKGEPPIVVDEAIYHPDAYYEELWLDHLRSGRALLLGRPVRVKANPDVHMSTPIATSDDDAKA